MLSYASSLFYLAYYYVFFYTGSGSNDGTLQGKPSFSMATSSIYTSHHPSPCPTSMALRSTCPSIKTAKAIVCNLRTASSSQWLGARGNTEVAKEYSENAHISRVTSYLLYASRLERRCCTVFLASTCRTLAMQSREPRNKCLKVPTSIEHEIIASCRMLGCPVVHPPLTQS